VSDPPKVFGPEAAIGQLQRHTLAVNDAAICFLAAGRERGAGSAVELRGSRVAA
jgi:hypothetical protein